MRLPEAKIAEALLDCIQAIAFVCGGCWLVFRYFAHERATSIATLRQQELANESASIQLATATRHDLLSLRQQELSNAQAQLTLEINNAQRNLHERELATEVALKQSDLQIRKLEHKKAEHDVEYSGGYRFERDLNITMSKRQTFPDGTAEFEIQTDFKFTNRSEVNFDVSVYVLDLYLGIPKGDRNAFWRLNKPNVRGDSVMTPYDGFEWELLGSIGGNIR